MSNPIQRLLEAERRASEVVNNARAHKVARFKLARCEVAEEVTNYKTKAENECKTQEEEVSNAAKEIQRQVEIEISEAMGDNLQLVNSNLDKAVQRLLEAICDIKCELHINYLGQERISSAKSDKGGEKSDKGADKHAKGK